MSPSARADAFSKLSTSIESFGASEVGMEYAGLTREQIIRFQADRRRASVSGLVTSIGDRLAAATADPAVAAVSAERGTGAA